jgi:hypothetical protein
MSRKKALKRADMPADPPMPVKTRAKALLTQWQGRREDDAGDQQRHGRVKVQRPSALEEPNDETGSDDADVAKTEESASPPCQVLTVSVAEIALAHKIHRGR